MKSVPCPSIAIASSRNRATSAVRSRKPRPRVCTVSNDETIEPAETVDALVREMVWDDVIATTAGSYLAADVLLHPTGHLDQPPPRLFEERHHPVHVAFARQWNFDLAFALGRLWLGLLKRI